MILEKYGKQLKNNLKEVCSTERCWIKQKFMENNLDSELYK